MLKNLLKLPKQLSS